MTHLLTTIGPCLLLMMVVVTPSTTEAVTFNSLRRQRKAITSTLSDLTRHHRHRHVCTGGNHSPVAFDSTRTAPALTPPRGYPARANRIPFAIGFAAQAS
jgi:hypothetical protein